MEILISLFLVNRIYLPFFTLCNFTTNNVEIMFTVDVKTDESLVRIRGESIVNKTGVERYTLHHGAGEAGMSDKTNCYGISSGKTGRTINYFWERKKMLILSGGG